MWFVPLHVLCTRKIVPFSNTGYSVPSLWKHFSVFAIDYLAIDTKQGHYYTDAHTRWLALSMGFPRGQCWACRCIDCSNGRWDDLLGPSKEVQHDFSGKVLFYGWSKVLQSCNEAIKFLPLQIPTFLYSEQVKSLMLHWKKQLAFHWPVVLPYIIRKPLRQARSAFSHWLWLSRPALRNSGKAKFVVFTRISLCTLIWSSSFHSTFWYHISRTIHCNNMLPYEWFLTADSPMSVSCSILPPNLVSKIILWWFVLSACIVNLIILYVS